MPTIPPDNRRPLHNTFMDEPLTVAAAKSSDVDAVEKLTHEFGRYLWSHLSRRSPSVFERAGGTTAFSLGHGRRIGQSADISLHRRAPHITVARIDYPAFAGYFDEVSAPSAAPPGARVSQPDSVLGRASAMTARRNALRMAKGLSPAPRSTECCKLSAGSANRGRLHSIFSAKPLSAKMKPTPTSSRI